MCLLKHASDFPQVVQSTLFSGILHLDLKSQLVQKSRTQNVNIFMPVFKWRIWTFHSRTCESAYKYSVPFLYLVSTQRCRVITCGLSSIIDLVNKLVQSVQLFPFNPLNWPLPNPMNLNLSTSMVPTLDMVSPMQVLRCSCRTTLSSGGNHLDSWWWLVVMWRDRHCCLLWLLCTQCHGSAHVRLDYRPSEQLSSQDWSADISSVLVWQL